MARLYELKVGDLISLDECNTNKLILMEKVKNPQWRWWKFWVKKYIGSVWRFE